jgi:nucleotide-binding universal stress UspA family protein
MAEDIDEFRKILVAVDGSEQSIRGLDVAISLAKKYNSLVRALYVVHIPLNENSYPQRTWYKDFKDDVNREARKWLTEIEKKGDENKVKIETRTIETTKPIPYEIAHHAESDKFELIVIGSKGRSGIEQLYLGSVASGVLIYASCPVLVIR